MRLSRGTSDNGLRCVEAANALIRVHKAGTQNQKLRTKTSKISMSQRDNRKSCHSDQLTHPINSVRGMLWGTKPKKLVNLTQRLQPTFPSDRPSGSLGIVLL